MSAQTPAKVNSPTSTVAHGGSWLIEPVGTRPVFVLSDFGPDEHQYAEVAEGFVRNEVLPRIAEIEVQKEGVMPSLLKKAGELGLLMVDVPEAYGGLGLSWATSMLVSERAAKCASFSVSWGAQHLEVFANMVIDVYAMDSVVARTMKLVATRGAEATAMERDLTHVFIASANERVADSARRLLANECEGEELRRHLAVVDLFQPFFPIRTIEMKTRIAKQVVEAGGAVTP